MDTPDNQPVTCVLCRQSHHGSVFYGDLLKKDEIAVHLFCLLFSDKLYSDVAGQGENALEAYDLQKVKDYVVKTKNQKCHFCLGNQATIICRAKSCKRNFHFKCGFDSERCLFKFDELYYAYCPSHTVRSKNRASAEDACCICLTEMDTTTTCGSISLNCRPHLWMHRACAIQLAANRGYDFQCPVCGDLKNFQKYVRLRGVFIPQRDTLTQAHNMAYQETQAKYCEAEVCLKTTSQKDPQAEDKLLVNTTESVKCNYCGKMFHCECALKQGTSQEDQRSFTCSSCMNLSEHTLSISSEEASEMNDGFDFGSDCSTNTVIPFNGQLKNSQDVAVVDMEAEMAKRFKFEHHYEWQPCQGYHNQEWRQFKLNLFMNTLRCRRKRSVLDLE